MPVPRPFPPVLPALAAALCLCGSPPLPAEEASDAALAADADAGTPGAPELHLPFFGGYFVGKATCPGDCALDAASAAAWAGATAGFEAGYAYVGLHRCTGPVYQTRELDPAAFAAEFGFGLERVGAAADAPVTMITVQCEGQPWRGPGSALLRTNDGRVFAWWERTWFALVPADAPPF